MKKVIIIGIALAAVTIGIFYFVFLKIKEIKENQTLTTQLSPALLEQLSGKQISDFSYNPAPIRWEGKYLQIDYGTVVGESQRPLHFVYNKKRNEKLNTARFFPGDDINGIVWLTQNFEVVGRYTGGGYASQPYYVLSYLDLAQQTVLARDTLWGGMPPQTTRNNSEVGKQPEEETVIKIIQLRAGNENL